MTKNVLNPKQTAYITAYTAPGSPTFGNSYRSAILAGYSDKTARNLSHLNPGWLTEAINSHTPTINPEELLQLLTKIIYDDREPTIIRLKAVEMTMRAYNMMSNSNRGTAEAISINVDLTAGDVYDAESGS